MLIASPVVSHPALAGNSSRINQMVDSLRSLGCDIHFLLCPIRLIQDTRSGHEMATVYGANYHELNGGRVIGGNLQQKVWRVLLRRGLRRFEAAQDVTITSGIFRPQDKRQFKEIVQKIRPDAVIFEYALMAELADCLDDTRRKIVDTHDSFTDRNKRIRASGGAGMWWSLSKRQERRLLSSFHRVIAIQQNEREHFTKLLAGSKTQVALVDILKAPAQHHRGGTPSNMVLGYIGSKNHHNVEGLLKFIEHQWPKIIAANPDVKLLVAGDLSIDRALPGVSFIGRVGDLWADFYSRCSVVINPCVSGTGLKIKTVEAMSYGVPVVTTHEGCSGIEMAVGQGLFHCSIFAADFHEHCVMLLIDDHRRARESEMARAFVETSMRTSIATLEHIIQ
ncbi:hypothetical protein ASF43_08680 [Pseudorhodoferax sp. Leaf267]|nr:hypothetical protein ASF43_08680 [Pseudorhodoferax sp. Leaf267]